MALQSTLHQCSPNKKKNPWNIIRKSKGPRIRYLSTNDAGGFGALLHWRTDDLSAITNQAPMPQASLGYADRHSGHSGHPGHPIIRFRSSDNSVHFDHFSPSSHPFIPVIPAVPAIPVIPVIRSSGHSGHSGHFGRFRYSSPSSHSSYFK